MYKEVKASVLEMLLEKDLVKQFAESKNNIYYIDKAEGGLPAVYVKSKIHGQVKQRTKFSKSADGYYKTTINMKTIYLHRAVAECWIFNPNPEVFTEIDHLDFQRDNCDYRNLRWLDRSGNMKHSWEAGRIGTKKSKLSEKQIEQIKSLYEQGATAQQLADMYSVSRPTIYRVVKKAVKEVA